MNPQLAEYVWFDGKLVPTESARVPITAHAIHYGTSAFEGIRAYWNSENLYIFRVDDHLRRLRRSGGYYSIPLPFSDEELKEAIIRLCRKNCIRESCYIRPFHFVGENGIKLFIDGQTITHMAIFALPFGDLFSKNGISACVSRWRKFSDVSTPTQAKMGGNYLNSIVATMDARERGFDEAILLNLRGFVSEAPGENVFVVRDGRLATPPVSSSALDGITRDAVFAISKDMGYRVSTRPVRQAQLYGADEIFLTGTAAEITPVTSIDGKEIGNGEPGPVTRGVMAGYHDIVTGRNEKYAGWLTGVY